MEKFQRNYELDVQTRDGGTLTVTPPFTLEFDIVRNTLSSSNVANFRVYNLGRQNRDSIRKNVNELGKFMQVELHAGYGDQLARCFSGNVSQGWSVREGVDFISEMDCYDAGFDFVQGLTAQAFAKGTSFADNMHNVIASGFEHVQAGFISPQFDRPLGRGNSFDGATIDVMRQELGENFFVDSGRLYALAQNECLEALGVDTVDASSGLLETPVLQDTIIRFSMLFEPRIRMAQALNLVSVTEPWLNGLYKVVSLHHHGTISDAVAGEAITEVGLFASLKGAQLEVVGGGL